MQLEWLIPVEATSQFEETPRQCSMEALSLRPLSRNALTRCRNVAGAPIVACIDVVMQALTPG